MAILKIARMGHPVLTSKAMKVDDPTSSSVRRLASDMLETMIDAPGVGLAAPQVHVPLRVIVFRVPPVREDDNQSVPATVIINPEITPLSDLEEEDIEGCLSIPQMVGMVPRYKKIRYQAYDLNGQKLEVDAEGYHARIIQHECDHLDGILYPMRMRDLSKFGFAEEFSKIEDHHVDQN